MRTPALCAGLYHRIQKGDRRMKKLYVVGMGPGDHDSMTIRADRVLRECDVIVGYTVYVELAEQYYPEKEFLTTPMRRETERCRLAFSEASKAGPRP